MICLGKYKTSFNESNQVSEANDGSIYPVPIYILFPKLRYIAGCCASASSNVASSRVHDLDFSELSTIWLKLCHYHKAYNVLLIFHLILPTIIFFFMKFLNGAHRNPLSLRWNFLGLVEGCLQIRDALDCEAGGERAVRTELAAVWRKKIEIAGLFTNRSIQQ